MSYIFVAILFLYLVAWVLKGVIYILCCTFTPLYNWAEQTAYRNRYPNNDTSRLWRFFAWPISRAYYLYKWLDSHVRDLLGQYLIFASLLIFLICVIIESENRGWFGYGALFLLTIGLIPTFFLSCVTEPLGLVRLSHLLGHVARFTYRRNYNVGPLFSAILAWKKVRNTEKADAHRSRLEDLLAQWYPKELGTIICRLLLASEDTEEDKVIGMLQTFYFTDSFKCPRRIKKHAGLWLVALESKRGNWQSVQKWSGLWLKKAPSTDLLFFYLVSRTMESGRVVGGGFVLCCSWIITLNYRYLPILKQALRKKTADMEKQLTLLDADSPDRVTGLQLLFHFAESSQLRENKDLLNSLALYFEAILAAERDKADTSIEKLQGIGQVEETLSHLLSSWDESAGTTRSSRDVSFLLNTIHDGEGPDLQEALDYHLQALQNRYTAGRFVDGEFEWREWVGVMILYHQLSLSDDTHYQAYQAVRPVCWDWAAWLWNEHSECGISSAVIRWIHYEALLMGDYDTAESMDRNLGMT